MEIIKIGTNNYVDLNAAAQGFSWAADQGAVVGNTTIASGKAPISSNK